jgi:peptidyl-prolyl cis-trans isomerase C
LSISRPAVTATSIGAWFAPLQSHDRRATVRAIRRSRANVSKERRMSSLHARSSTLLGLALAGLCLTLTPASVPAQDRDPVAARVNGFEIRQSDLAIAEEEIGEALPGNGAEKREALINYYADMILMARAAESKGMGSTVEFARKLGFAKTKLLMETLLRAEAKSAVTDAELRKVYDQAVKQMGKEEEEVRARHILVESEDEAKAVLAELKNGGDFEKLAKAKSKDPSAAQNGGDLGYFTKDQMVPEFAETAFKLPKGQLSDPVKTQFGWHVIRAEDKRAKAVPTFDQVRPQLVQFVVRNAQAAMVAKLREGAKIEKLPPPAEQK